MNSSDHGRRLRLHEQEHRRGEEGGMCRSFGSVPKYAVGRATWNNKGRPFHDKRKPLRTFWAVDDLLRKRIYAVGGGDWAPSLVNVNEAHLSRLFQADGDGGCSHSMQYAVSTTTQLNTMQETSNHITCTQASGIQHHHIPSRTPFSHYCSLYNFDHGTVS